MKLLFASDIHGDSTTCEELIQIFKTENADMLVLSGDLLYHGPRNDLPEGYNPKEVIELLNSVSNKIIAVRGNCDSEVDQMVLDFPMMADYTLIYADGIKIYVTHGHIYSPQNPLKLSDGEIMVSGHTHVLNADRIENKIFLNPGSVSIPKENNPKTYMVYEKGEFTIKTLQGDIIKSVNVTMGECI